MIKSLRRVPTVRSERIVVDEVFPDGKARILRAARNVDAADGDVSIRAWGDEREEVISEWRLEAFVGFKNGRKLQEGDVFLIIDGTKLVVDYDPKALDISRDVARQEHLLVDVDVSRQAARQESCQLSYLLTAVRLAQGDKHTEKTLIRRVDKKFCVDE